MNRLVTTLDRAVVRRWGFAVAVVVAVLVAISYTTDGSATRLSNGQLIGQISAFLIATLGLNILVGRVGMHSFAQGAFMAIGAYAFVFVQMEWTSSFLVGLIVAAVLPAIAGVIIAASTTRMRGPQLAMVTLILAVVVQKFFSEASTFGQFGGYPSVSTHGSSLIEPPTLVGWVLEPPLFGGVAATALVPVLMLSGIALLLCRRLVHTPWGLSLSTIKESEILASHLGINVYLRKISVVAFTAALAGVGGACYAAVFAHLQPEVFSLMLGVNLIVMVILGGSGTVLGPLIGTAAIVYLQTAPSVAAFVRWENDVISDRWYLSAQGLIALLMVILLFVMPQGIAGALRDIARKWLPRRTTPTSSFDLEQATERLFGAGESATAESLQLKDVSLSFGGVRAVDGVSISVEPGSLVALIGPNGAGKSSVVNIITGVYRSRTGDIHLGTDRLDTAPSHARTRRGVSRTFQTPILCPELTVADNVAVGNASTSAESLLAAIVSTPTGRRRRSDERERVEAALELVGLSELAELPADELSYGQQRLVELARALVSGPQVLVLDEPAAGLNPTEIAVLADLLDRLRSAGLGILLVEHHMDLVRRIADRVVCMIDGSAVAEGDAESVLTNPEVVHAYLGANADPMVVAGDEHA